MAKTGDPCFLCEQTGKKLKKFTFYSGIKKGGTTHRTIHYKVTFLERWSELTMHEIHVCRDCTQELWQEQRKKQFLPMVLLASGAAISLLIALICGILLPGLARYMVAFVFLAAALGLGGLAIVFLQRYRMEKPPAGRVDLLVLEEALDKLPYEEHTYLTSDQYAERYDMGVLG